MCLKEVIKTNSFDLKIITLDGIEFDGKAVSVVARTTVGDICILHNHTNYVGAIELGKVKVKTETETRIGACAGGFLSVTDNKVRIVATTFEFADEIDIERAKRAKEKAEERMNQKKSDAEYKMAEFKLKRALLRLDVSSGK